MGSGDQAGVDGAGLAVSEDKPVLALDIDAIYGAHAAFITRALVRLVGSGAHVDDLVQETFLVAYRRRLSFDGRAAVRTWLYAIAQRLAMRHRRGAGRFLRAIGRLGNEPERVSSNPQNDLDRARAAVLVRSALERLPFKQREVFALYELEELEGTEIAVLLNIPINTVWTRLHHGRKRFNDLMRKRIDRSTP